MISEMNKKNMIELFPIILFMSFVPLVVRIKILQYPIKGLVWDNRVNEYANIFTYYKGVFIILAAIIAGILLLKKYLLDKDNFNFDFSKKLIFSLIGFIIISFIFSTYKSIGLSGDKSRAEGLYVLISYFIMVLYIGDVIRFKRSYSVILTSLYIAALILGSIGVAQYLGYDIFKNELFQKIYLTKEISGNELNFNMDGRVFLTMFNPNYVGTYVTLISGVALNMLIRTKSYIKKVAWFILLIFMVISLVGARSEAGFVGIIVVSIATIIANYKLVIRKKIAAFILIVIIISASYVLFIKYEEHPYIRNIKNTVQTISVKKESPLQGIVTYGDKLFIDYNGTKITFDLDDEKPTEIFELIVNDKVLELEFNEDGQFYYPQNEKFSSIRIYYFNEKNLDGYRLKIHAQFYPFLIFKDNLVYMNKIKNFTSLAKVDKFEPFDGYERLGSGRIYIWSRSIPLLKRTWLVGFGPDNFKFYFPQKDYIGQTINGIRLENSIIDKPHNMYLQFAINIGLIPLLILLCFWIYVLYKLFVIIKEDSLPEDYITVAIISFVSVLGYMSVGVFNDSTVNVASVFWGMLGLGLSIINYDKYIYIGVTDD